MPHYLTVKALASVILGGALALSACVPAPPASSTGPTPGNAVVTITMDEWNMKPSIASVPAGKVSFLVINQGIQEHEAVLLKTDRAASALVLQRATSRVDEMASGQTIGEIEVEAGTTEAGTFNLAPGHYAFVCNLPEHFTQGMYFDFEVTATAAPEIAPRTSASQETAVVSRGAVSGTRKDVTFVKAVRPTLTNTVDAVRNGDLAGAKKAFAAYDTAWNGIEIYINFRSPVLYGELESDIQARLTKLLDDPSATTAEILPVAEAMLAKYDEAIEMVENSPAISPLFDDLAALRIVRANTIRGIDPMLRAGDVTGAKAAFTMFMGQWSDVEDIIKAYSADAYTDTEAAMAKANVAFQKSAPDAAELRPLVAEVLARYNSGLSLVNAAARNADLS